MTMTINDGAVIGTTQIFGSAPPARAFNMVLLAEGFQVGQQADFDAAADAVVAELVKTAPFDDFTSVINAYRVNISSTDSGADDPVATGGSGATAATYFDATFGGDGKLRRTLVCDAQRALSTAAAQVPQVTAAMVLVNSTIPGGSGLGVGTFSLAPGTAQTAIHEMGHSVFGLADEYACRACSATEDVAKTNNVHPKVEPHQPNITVNRNRNTLKWGWAVEQATPIPTMTNPNCLTVDDRPSPVPAATVGTFEGADYFHCNAFRPQYDCRMRTAGSPFCRVCQQVIRDRLFSLSTLVAQDRTPLSVVARDSAHLDVFAVAADSRTVSDRWDIANGWAGWSQISGGSTFPGGTGSPVTSVSRGSDRIDAFVVGGDGHVWTAWWGPLSGWSPWSQVGTLTVRRGSTVTVVARTPQTMDLFTTASDGAIMWTSADPSGGWAQWSHLSGGHAAAGSVITANSRWAAHLDVFAIGTDNRVWTVWWNQGSGWSGWFEVDHLVARPDSTVTVINRGMNLDLFTTAADGRIMSTTGSETTAWTAWFPISGGHACAGSPVTAIARVPDHIDLFVVGQDNGIYSTHWDTGSSWANWFNVSGGNARPGSQIAAIARFPQRLDIFAVGGDANVYSAGWDGANGWSHWFAVGVT
jgi:hypothetical protein